MEFDPSSKIAKATDSTGASDLSHSPTSSHLHSIAVGSQHSSNSAVIRPAFPAVESSAAARHTTSFSSGTSSRGSPTKPARVSDTRPQARATVDAADAAQALLGLSAGQASSESAPESRKRRKRAVEMTPEELVHARETNKKSAQQFRERERLRRMDIKAKGDRALRVNDDLRREISGLLSIRRSLAAEVRRVMLSSPQLAMIVRQFKV